MRTMIFLLLGMLLHAEPDWMTYDDAFKAARADHRGVMVMLTQENCPICDYMKEYPLDDDEVLAKLKEHFVAVELDVKAHRLRGLSYYGTPTFYFLDVEGHRLLRHDGVAKIEPFLTLIDDATKKLLAR